MYFMIIKAIKQLNNNYKHFYILSYYCFILLLYKTFNREIVPEHFMYSYLDDYIPFVKEMIIPYLYWYIYIAVTLIYLGFKNKNNFYNLAIFMFAGMTFSFIIYAIFPNGQNLRPIIQENDIFSRVVQGIYNGDKPTNSAPSMHVINTLAVYVAIKNDEALSEINWVRIGSFISMILIILSTMMVKQHSILDVFAGMIVSVVLYLLIYKLDIINSFVRLISTKRNSQSIQSNKRAS
ncbi:phosphatase PAP2 family protein [Clostridium sp. DL1XJH146]